MCGRSGVFPLSGGEAGETGEGDEPLADQRVVFVENCRQRERGGGGVGGEGGGVNETISSNE